MTEKLSKLIPVLPLRDVVLFPHMIMPLYVGRAKSLAALKKASGKYAETNEILLVSQKDAAVEDPDISDLRDIGTTARIVQSLCLPDGNHKVLVEGLKRCQILEMRLGKDGCIYAKTEEIPNDPASREAFEPLRRAVISTFELYQKSNKRITAEKVAQVSSIKDAHLLVDTIAQLLSIPPARKMPLLECSDPIKRIENLLSLLEEELDIQQTENRIRTQVKKAMEKNQRDYYLTEQVKAIQKELGGNAAEFDQLEKEIKEAKMSAEAEKKALTELGKLRMMNPNGAEYTVSRNYLDTLLSLPWSKESKVNSNLVKAEKILNDDHYGLERVKERILEYLAVQARVKKLHSPILCLVGAPGVGKTSLGQSVARATGRKFVRMALGGVRDESEIRGHRRTYIGSMPGRIIQSITKAGTKNPLFLLDEVDKMGMDYRGDPAAALLEVLDPEQNNTFQDHYLDVEYDLSSVMFIATSNSMNIPKPLLDRMEVINLSGYTEEEKLHIAFEHLIPKQMKVNGVKASELTFSEEAIKDIIRYYTREAGVRGLEKEINRICRKLVRKVSGKKGVSKVEITPENLGEYLGVKKFNFGVGHKKNLIGQVTGLAWTEVGGDLLTIEVATMEGKGNIIHTGSLGDVMKESVEAARTVVRSRAEKIGITYKQISGTDIHVHFPEGAVPKDGPSAGAAITLGLISGLTGIPVRADVAMTGEITLRGEILPIGGLKEKLLAALRGGLKIVLIPEENMKDLEEVPACVKDGLCIVPVKTIDQVLEYGLERMPKPADKKEEKSPNPIKLPDDVVEGKVPLA